MIQALSDGSYRVQMWTHPRTLKIHIREDCKAMRRLVVEVDANVIDFPDRESIQAWFDAEAETDPEMVCGWCFPAKATERSPETETHEADESLPFVP